MQLRIDAINTASLVGEDMQLSTEVTAEPFRQIVVILPFQPNVRVPDGAQNLSGHVLCIATLLRSFCCCHKLRRNCDGHLAKLVIVQCLAVVLHQVVAHLLKRLPDVCLVCRAAIALDKLPGKAVHIRLTDGGLLRPLGLALPVFHPPPKLRIFRFQPGIGCRLRPGLLFGETFRTIPDGKSNVRV